MQKIHEFEEQGLLNMKKHPIYPLFILNYTSKAQFKKRWCKELIHARGLVVKEDGEIIARPIPKFFNHYEIKKCEQLQHEDYELYDKMDGSLAIMFYYENKRMFCTRGSFVSDQAVKSEKIFNSKYNHVNIKKECTYCFEVIYPKNKVVVDYDGLEDLFLISISHTKSGKELNIDNAGFKTVNKIDTDGVSSNEWIHCDIPNKEGYVVKFINDNLRLKIKFDSYIARHNGKTMSTKTIKKNMKKMENINLDNIPDESYPKVREITSEIEEIFNTKKQMLENVYSDIVKVNASTRDVAKAIKQSQYSSILFAMYRGKPIDKMIWRLV